MLRLLRLMRQERYDVAIDMMDNPSATSTAFCVLSGARWTVGLEKENDYSYDVIVPLRSRRDRHIIERLAPLAEVFGIPATEAERPVQYQPSEEALASADEAYVSLGVADRIKIGVNISAGSERRYWGTERFQELVRTVSATLPSATVCLLCKPSDEPRARSIVAGIGGAVVVPPSRSFDAFAAAVAQLDALLTPDTSVVHLASAFGIPCVVLYIQSNPELRIWDPYGAPHVPVVTTEDDLASISVTAVVEAWRKLIAEYPVSHPRSLSPRQRS
jgi:ADP-heptose:LPS heptosyltransferase